MLQCELCRWLAAAASDAERVGLCGDGCGVLVEAMTTPSDLMSNLTVTFTLVTAPTDLSVAASDLSAFNCNLTAGDFVVTTVWLRLNSELVAGEQHCQFPRQRRDADRGPALVDLP